MKLPLAIRILGLYGITLGLVALSTNYLSSQAASSFVANNSSITTTKNSQTSHQSSPSSLSQTASDETTPEKLTIDTLDLTLNIKPGLYDAETKQWTLNDSDAFYVTVSRKINNQSGTTVIYGHDRAAVFEPLEKLNFGDKISILTSDSRQFTYQYRDDKSVSPVSVEVLYEASSTPQLVLMTCDGVWSEVRRVLYFDLIEVRDV